MLIRAVDGELTRSPDQRDIDGIKERITARVEIVGPFGRIAHYDVRRQKRVERAFEFGQFKWARRRKRRNLPQRVNSRVRASGPMHSHSFGEQLREGGLHSRLDRVLAALELPAGVVGAVVFERKFHAHESRFVSSAVALLVIRVCSRCPASPA